MKLSAQRILEIFPGVMTWMTFIVPVILSYTAPKVISIAMLLFATYWLMKAMVMSVHLIIGYIRFKHDTRLNWLSKCQHEFQAHEWKKIYHLCVIATYKEELSTLEGTFDALLNSTYPNKKLIVALGIEERDQENGLANAKALEKKYGHLFYKFIYTVHPSGIPGEMRGKGSNISYCARIVKEKIIDYLKIPYEDIIVTSLDADHRVDTQYFACITYNYLTTPDPTHKSFQPLPLFFNNIWETAFPMRIIALSSSFWQMIEATRPYRLRNFAAHAQSFAGLVETDFWAIDTIVEDGHQYWRSYFTFNGNYSVIPIFVPVYQDAVFAGDFWTTAKEQYLQKRRWAWGASDIPYAIIHAIKNKKAPFEDKWLQIFRLIEGHYSWATTSIAIGIISWMPLVLNKEYNSTVLATNFPYYYSRILWSAMISLLISLIISTLLLPPPSSDRRLSFWRKLLYWIITPVILPITNVIFSSFPAIDSQTRLIFGWYLDEFHVTIKKPVATHTYSTLKQ